MSSPEIKERLRRLKSPEFKALCRKVQKIGWTPPPEPGPAPESGDLPDEPAPRKNAKRHGMQRDRRSGFWKVRVPGKDGGRAHWLTTGEKDEKEAMEVVDASGIQKLSILARAKCLTADAISIIAAGHKTTALEVAKAWRREMAIDFAPMTVRNYFLHTTMMLRDAECTERPVSWISRQLLHNFINDDSIKHSSRTLRLAAIKAFYRYASAYGHIIGNIADTLRINKRTLTVVQRQKIPVPPFTDEEYRLIVSNPAVPRFWRWATALGYWLGLRMCDVCSLQWASLGEDFVILYPQKTGRELKLFMDDPLVCSGELKAVLDEMRAVIEPKETYCWPNRAARYPGEFGDNVFNQYQEVLKLCGIKGKTFHGWRHTFRLRLSNSGRPLADISLLMGHKDVMSTLGYGRALPCGAQTLSLAGPMSVTHGANIAPAA